MKQGYISQSVIYIYQFNIYINIYIYLYINIYISIYKNYPGYSEASDFESQPVIPPQFSAKCLKWP